MKTFYIILALLLTISAASAQNKVPDEQSIVNKEYDEDGNLIRYDSTFVHSWSSDSTFNFPLGQHDFFAGNFEEMEKMLKEMMNDSMFLGGEHLPFGDLAPFQSFANPDSAFSGRFQNFNDSAFSNHDFMFPDIEELKKKMEDQMRHFDFFSAPEMHQDLTDEQLNELKELQKKQRKEMEDLRKSWQKKENE